MATEGQFPKGDGDVLYASEANKFREKVIGFVGVSSSINSGTAYQPLGSVLYSGIYPSLISDHIVVDAGLRMPFNTDYNSYFQFRISGTEYVGSSTAVLYAAGGTGQNHETSNKWVVDSGTFASYGANFGSPFVVFFEAKTDLNGQAVCEYLSVLGV